MSMDCGGGQGHGSADVLDLKPGAFEIVGTFKFRDHADRALLNHLRNKLVRIEQFAANRDEQTSLSSLSRVVRDVGNHQVIVAAQLAVDCFGYVRKRYRLSAFDSGCVSHNL